MSGVIALRGNALGVELYDLTGACVHAKAATFAEALIYGDSSHWAPLSSFFQTTTNLGGEAIPKET